MNESNKESNQESAVPVPFSVLALGWIVSGLAANVIAPPLAPIVWVAGPCVMFYKMKKDSDRFAAQKDNPGPKLYDVPREIVLHAFDQAIKTLPGYFNNVSIQRGYESTQTPSNVPMHLEYTIHLDHPEVNRKTLQPNQKPTSDIFIRAYISESGKQARLDMQFVCKPLFSRTGLDPIIDHLTDRIDFVVEQHKK